jgi:hypothetical protein
LIIKSFYTILNAMPFSRSKEISQEARPNHQPIVGGAQGGVTGQLLEEVNQNEDRGKIVAPIASGMAAESRNHPQEETETTSNF